MLDDQLFLHADLRRIRAKRCARMAESAGEMTLRQAARGAMLQAAHAFEGS
ncbi:hypothetical protein OHZ10_35175 [Burkholderia arboris]|uniref:Uncharacterized protein n=1 Tax=Burkholderia arboris TaxID=488730 RepID=A0ABZ3DYW5_9BURK|nr:hypothetical protein [Burkholderia arboris]